MEAEPFWQTRNSTSSLAEVEADEWDDICGLAEKYLSSKLGTIDAAVMIAAEQTGASVAKQGLPVENGHHE